MDSDFSRRVHVGEQNIVENHSYINENGNFTHEIRIEDGSSAPFCTQEALKDHLGELGTATDIKSEVNVVFDSPCDEYAKERYDDFRDLMAKNYTNMEIRYPWDDVKE